MTLIDRYVSAVANRLSKADRDDIANELRDVLSCKVEDREAELGRSMTAAEIKEMLKGFGNPVAVAGRYAKRQYLIGPELLPFYLQTLKAVLTLLAVVAALLALPVLWDGNVMLAVFRALGLFWEFAVIAALVITVIFAAMEVLPKAKALGADWDPDDLPQAHGLPRRTTGELIFEMAAGVIFLALWTGVWRADLWPVTFWTWGQGVDIRGTAIWDTLYWPILVVFVLGVALNLADLLRPRWGRGTSLVYALNNAATVILIVILLASYPWIEAVGDAPAARQALVERNANLSVGLILFSVGVIVAFDAVKDFLAWRGVSRRTAATSVVPAGR